MTIPYTDLQDLNQTSGFIELYTLDLTQLGGGVYHYTNFVDPSGDPIKFNATTYVSLPIKCEGWDYVSTGQSPKPTLTVSNVSKAMLNAVVSLGDIVGAKVTRYRTYEKYLDINPQIRRNFATSSELATLPNHLEDGGLSWQMGLSLGITGDMIASPFAGTSVYKAYEPYTGSYPTNCGIFQTINTEISTPPNLTSGAGSVYHNVLLPPSDYTFTVYLKYGSRQFVYVTLITDQTFGGMGFPGFGINKDYTVVVDLQNGVITSEHKGLGYDGNLPTNTGSNITSVGNGWYRVSVTARNTNKCMTYGVGTTDSGTPTFDTNVGAFQGLPTVAPDSTKGVFIYGAQLEAGQTPTPYQSTYRYRLPGGAAYTSPDSKFIGPDVFLVEQKIAHNKDFISWQLTSKMDRMGIKLPRRQVLKDRGFPGVARTRIR